MNYLDSDYNEYLDKTYLYEDQREMSARETDSLIKQVPLYNLKNVGTIYSENKRVYFDTNNNKIVVNDGVYDVVELGDHADGTSGLLLKNNLGNTIFDNTGVYGSNVFKNGIATKTSDQTSSSDVFADITQLNHSITLQRTTPVLFYSMIWWKDTGIDADILIRIVYNNNYYPTGGNSFNASPYYLVDATTNLGYFTFTHLLNLPNGTNMVKLQFAMSSPDETGTIEGLNNNSTFSYIVLGN